MGLDRLFVRDDNSYQHLGCREEADDPDPCTALTTVRYKSGVREYIQSQGYRIVANFGDQLSDLQGGHADRRYKLPNPMYFVSWSGQHGTPRAAG